MRPSIALLATAAVGLALPAGAAASSVASTNPGVPGATIELLGTKKASDVTLTRGANSELQLTDAAQRLKAGAGCTAGSPVVCPLGPLNVTFGSAADRFSGFSMADISVWGGAGGDTIAANGSRTTVWAGGGDDTLDLGSNGRSTGHGGAGDDHLRGRYGVETFLQGDAGTDLLVGGAPQPHLDGGIGADQLFVRGVQGTADGGDGDDVLVVLPSGSFVPPAFTFSGGAGSDVLVAGPGVDHLDGGADDDLIDVSGDGSRSNAATAPDTVDCGDGVDTVWIDPADSAAATCEQVLPGPMPANAGVAAAYAHLYESYPDEAPAS